jgi:hypothetical protein
MSSNLKPGTRSLSTGRLLERRSYLLISSFCKINLMLRGFAAKLLALNLADKAGFEPASQ